MCRIAKMAYAAEQDFKRESHPVCKMPNISRRIHTETDDGNYDEDSDAIVHPMSLCKGTTCWQPIPL